MIRPFLVVVAAAFAPSLGGACQPSSVDHIANALLSADAVFIARPSRLEMVDIDPDHKALDDSETWETSPLRPITVKFDVEEVWKGTPPEEVLSLNLFFCGGGWVIGFPQIFAFSNGEENLAEAWHLPADIAKLPFLSLPDWTISGRQTGFADHRVFFERISDGADPTKAAAGLHALRRYIRGKIQPLE